MRALLPLTTTVEGQVRPEAVAEMKRMVRAYIEDALSEQQPKK